MPFSLANDHPDQCVRARSTQPVPRQSRSSNPLALALLVAACGATLLPAAAAAEERRISLHHTHTGESIDIVFKRNGKYDDAALTKLNHFLRDWRNDKQTRMDPQLFDIIWEVKKDVGTNNPAHIISAYRSPETNSMLRRRGRGVAQFSQHMLGNAIDFFIPGVPLDQLRAAGLRQQRGGVGFYPTSGSPFVHLDVGSVRHWPRMTRDQLARVFPNGRTVHVPSDGQPLPNYAAALADVQKRGSKPSAVSLAAAGRSAGADDEEDSKPNVIARLFGFKGDADKAAPARAERGKERRTIEVDDKASDKGKYSLASAAPMPPVRTRDRAAEAPADVVASRWTDGEAEKNAERSDRKEPRLAWRTGAQPVRGADKADDDIDPNMTSSFAPSVLGQTRANDRVPTELLLAYAAGAAPDVPARKSPAPMGAVRVNVIGDTMAAAPAAKSRLSLPNTGNSWLRSLMFTPGRALARKIPTYSSPEYTRLVRFMPASRTVATAFSADGEFELSAQAFAGEAIATVPVVRFSNKTARLR